MKALLALTIALCIPVASRAVPDAKAALIHEIVQIQGVDEMLLEAKKAASAQAQEMVKQMFDQVRVGMPALSKEKFDAIQVAADQMLHTIEGSWSTEDAISVWEAEFTIDFTEAELRSILEACKTPIGKKQIAAGKRAGSALQKYLLQSGKSKMDAAVREYVAAIQQIVTDTPAEE